jgi:hypothetical protein
MELPPEVHVKSARMEAMEQSLLRKLKALRRRWTAGEEAELVARKAAVDKADRMRAAGLCPWSLRRRTGTSLNEKARPPGTADGPRGAPVMRRPVVPIVRPGPTS